MELTWRIRQTSRHEIGSKGATCDQMVIGVLTVFSNISTFATFLSLSAQLHIPLLLDHHVVSSARRRVKASRGR